MGVLRRGAKEDGETDMHDVHTLLGPESHFEGKLVFEGTVRVDGRFIGEVHTEGNLIVGHGARVEGTLQVGHVVVHGEVHGDIVASRAVEVHAPGKVRGNITTPQLTMDKGVVFDGTCTMSGEPKGAENVTRLDRSTLDVKA